MKCEMVERIRRCTLICDIGYPESDSRSISDRSNLYRSFPILLSMDRADQGIGEHILSRKMLSVMPTKRCHIWPELLRVPNTNQVLN